MNESLIVEDVIASLERRFGQRKKFGKARIFTFGSALTCSINYSKFLGGHKYFFGLPQDTLSLENKFPQTKFGEFVLLICGAANNVLVLPRPFIIEMMKGVKTRRVDIFCESGTYILQTTKHPKCNVTEFLNAFPSDTREPSDIPEEGVTKGADRIHLKIQWGLIALGQAEGCSVWVPVHDRNLAYQRQSFARCTLSRLPNFGFEENTRRIVQNIDVLWLTKNVIQKAFEIESTSSIYSGLLRLNDLVLAQPNNQIDLYIATSRSRRDKVNNQLIRPSFQSLLSRCMFIAFEDIEDQMSRLETFPLDKGARISGLIRGEKLTLPEHYVYPGGL